MENATWELGKNSPESFCSRNKASGKEMGILAKKTIEKVRRRIRTRACLYITVSTKPVWYGLFHAFSLKVSTYIVFPYIFFFFLILRIFFWVVTCPPVPPSSTIGCERADGAPCSVFVCSLMAGNGKSLMEENLSRRRVATSFLSF